MPPRYIDQETLLAREEEILGKAVDIILQEGIASLTMDKLVESVSYSKGTVYNHFGAKEDVCAALCAKNMEKKLDLFSRAAALQVSARERMIAISFSYMLTVIMSPHHFALVMNAKTEMFEKVSEARRERHKCLDDQLFAVICGIIQDAITDHELVLQEGVDVQQVSFSLWAMAFGTISLLLDGEIACSPTFGMMLENRVIEHGNIVMDGLGWSKSEQGQQDFIDYLKTDVFLEEINSLKQQGLYLP